jgi:hypothetical protein
MACACDIINTFEQIDCLFSQSYKEEIVKEIKDDNINYYYISVMKYETEPRYTKFGNWETRYISETKAKYSNGDFEYYCNESDYPSKEYDSYRIKQRMIKAAK